MAKQVKMRDIAQQLGISTVTVSKALGDKYGVSEGLRAQIKQTAKQMGYQYHESIAAESQSLSVGILVANRFFIDSSFYNNLYHHVIKSLSEKGCFGILEMVSEQQETGAVCPSLIQNKKVNAVIIMGQLADNYLQMLQRENITFLCLDFYSDPIGSDCVVSDSVFGSYCLTNYLVEKGHTEIAYIGSIQATTSIMDRYLGYVRSMLVHGLKIKEDWVIEDRDVHGAGIEIKYPREMPTAFVCNSDYVAARVITELKEKGYRVPEDISVVGFDDYIYSTLSDPPITTYRVEVGLMSKVAVSMILKRLEQSDYPIGRRIVGGCLIKRDSVSKCRR